ncbi:MAG: hypothetical protein HOQ03_10485 [Thermoleophilia bacterium]|nr:hypothetical protein [Thermoleophilia bacterium]
MATSTTSLNGRSADAVRREIERERHELALAVEQLRDGLGEATNIGAKLRAHLPVVVVGALGAGFVLAGGIGATMRFLARKGRER